MHLRFADDIELLAESLQGLDRMLSSLNAASRRVGLGMNLTMVMFNAHVTQVFYRCIYLGQTLQLGRDNFEGEPTHGKIIKL